MKPVRRLAAFVRRLATPTTLAPVTSQVDDRSGWVAFQGGPNDRDAGEMQQLYTDTLEAWRKNPLAKRIVDCITDYVLGDGMAPAAPGQIGRFVSKFWTHPKNHMDRRLPVLNEELARAGDLFLTLHRNPEDGLSYIRPIPKDRILKIETLPNDWETEIAYHEILEVAGEQRVWYSPFHPAAAEAPAIMLHYSVNSVVGALLGESDLATMIPWLLRYSRLIEDRVRLHWASRAFLWMVTVPPNLVKAKQEQYRTAPASGSIIVKDDSETWESVSPDLKGFDAQFDSRSVRQMIDAGSGMPPHWRGEAHDVSLATAQAMEHSASRHLRRRQLYLRFVVQDLCHHAYTRAFQLGKVRAKPNAGAITVQITDIDRDDNEGLATAAKTIAEALQTLSDILPAQKSPTLRRRILQMVMRFAGEILPETAIDQILREIPAEIPTSDAGAGASRPLSDCIAPGGAQPAAPGTPPTEDTP
jgi:hypothetical protein